MTRTPQQERAHQADLCERFARVIRSEHGIISRMAKGARSPRMLAFLRFYERTARANRRAIRRNAS